MSFHPFLPIRVVKDADITQKNINAMQNNIKQALDQITNKDFLDQKLLVNLTLLPGIINKVAHGLGRKIQGAYPVMYEGSFPILTYQQSLNKSPELLLYVQTPVAITLNLLVF